MIPERSPDRPSEEETAPKRIAADEKINPDEDLNEEELVEKEEKLDARHNAQVNNCFNKSKYQFYLTNI